MFQINCTNILNFFLCGIAGMFNKQSTSSGRKLAPNSKSSEDALKGYIDRINANREVRVRKPSADQAQQQSDRPGPSHHKRARISTSPDGVTSLPVPQPPAGIISLPPPQPQAGCAGVSQPQAGPSCRQHAHFQPS